MESHDAIPSPFFLFRWFSAMYDRPLQSPDDLPVLIRRLRQHRGTWQKFVGGIHETIVRAIHEGPASVKEILPNLLTWISDARTLRAAWNTLAQKNTAPGPNGHHFNDFDHKEVWELLRTIGKAIRAGTYRVGEERTIHIPKDPTNRKRGKRPITLSNIEDRVVQRAAFDILKPLLYSLFGDSVFGYRARRNQLYALASAERQVVENNRYVIVVDDIQNAFTRVAVDRLLKVLKFYIPNDEVHALLKVLLDQGKKHSIRQGSPLSPVLLNLYLHHFLDQPWQKLHPDVTLIRWADDLLLPCRTPDEAVACRASLIKLLRPANMSLKGTPCNSIHDLRYGQTVDWLGFQIGKKDLELEVKITAKAWEQLEKHLALAHEKPHTPLRASETIKGWIEALGPCYPFVEHAEVYEQVAALAAKQAFDEIPSRRAMKRLWQRAYERWNEIRKECKNGKAAAAVQ
jgi:RNA-directed DNA polymerase